jgi:hypothetical protein
MRYAFLLLALLIACGPKKESIVLKDSNEPKLDIPFESNIPGKEGAFGNENLDLQAAPATLTLENPRSPDWKWHGIIKANAQQGEQKVTEINNSAFTWNEKDNGQLLLLQGLDSVLVYNYGPQLPQDIPPDRARSSYIHPLWSPSGIVITDDFPKDHLHHRGLSWMWPRVVIDKDTLDHWHIKGIKTQFNRWLGKYSGPLCATVGVENDWIYKENSVLKEIVWIKAFKQTMNSRAIDLSLTLEAQRPITLQGQVDKGYGGLCLRLAPRDEPAILSPKGWEMDSDLESLAWTDQSGLFTFSQQMAGIAIFQHSENPDFPAGWTLRHYGFLGVAWPGIAKVTLEPGNPVHLRFRIWVHDGDAFNANVTEAYQYFLSPPEITW